jgi:TatD DNase family protein
MLIETHAHLDFPEYDNDRDDVIKRANNSGVAIIINVSSSLKGSFASAELSNNYDCIYAACGIHPHDAKSVTDDAIQKIKELASSSQKVVAIGETGLDFYRNLSEKELQYNAFVKFINLSKELHLPLILHCREESHGEKDAQKMLFKAMRENLKLPFRGVMHCFSGDTEFLEECLDSGLCVSFTCNVTFKNAGRLRDILKITPLDRLLLETDSPFLAPQAKRGSRNEPCHISYLVETISDTIGVTKAEIEDITTKNAKELFCIS